MSHPPAYDFNDDTNPIIKWHNNKVNFAIRDYS
jgi:hypothetical protein